MLVFIFIDWGKRLATSQPNVNFLDIMETQQHQEIDKNLPNNLQLICKPSMENLLIIYRYIQNEAQNVVQCSQDRYQ